MVLIGALGLGMDRLMRLLERRVTPWVVSWR
jgi:ABC-type nitrate/sulfonate/bicarbonate transport system permease component